MLKLQIAVLSSTCNDSSPYQCMVETKCYMLQNQNTYQNVHSCKLTNRHEQINQFDGIYRKDSDFAWRLVSLPEVIIQRKQPHGPYDDRSVSRKNVGQVHILKMSTPKLRMILPRIEDLYITGATVSFPHMSNGFNSGPFTDPMKKETVDSWEVSDINMPKVKNEGHKRCWRNWYQTLSIR